MAAMRVEPPTSSTCSISSGSMPLLSRADSIAWSRQSSERWRRSSMSASNVARVSGTLTLSVGVRNGRFRVATFATDSSRLRISASRLTRCQLAGSWVRSTPCLSLMYCSTCPVIRSSKSPPPSRGSPPVPTTLTLPGLTWMIDTSKVPPPRSYTA